MLFRLLSKENLDSTIDPPLRLYLTLRTQRMGKYPFLHRLKRTLLAPDLQSEKLLVAQRDRDDEDDVDKKDFEKPVLNASFSL